MARRPVAKIGSGDLRKQGTDAAEKKRDERLQRQLEEAAAKADDGE